MNSTPNQPDGGQTPTPPANTDAVVVPPTQPGAAGPPSSLLSVPYLTETLEEAELLLGYAAEVGIAVDATVRDGVFKARIAGAAGGLTQQHAADLLTSLTTLAAKVKPVTVESLRTYATPRDAREAIHFYGKVAIWVGCMIVLFSLVTFVSTSVADRIKADVTTANALAAKLRAELGPWPDSSPAPVGVKDGAGQPAPLSENEKWFGTPEPPHGLTAVEIITDLQQFTATTREIDGYARRLKHFLLDFGPLPYSANRTNDHRARRMFELTPGLDVRLAGELRDRVEEYQTVRGFANNLKERVTVYYGAIATCILPVLYALLGAGAYLLRLHEDQVANRTFVAGNRHIARFLIAGIGGLVVGLFNVSQAVTISPFALAFLVGYAVDVFYTFLEGLLQMFKRAPGSGGAPAPPPTR